MLAAAVGTAPGTARTKNKCPGIVQVIKMGVISGLESQNGRPSAPRASIVVPADGQPWRCPAGKPWHEFVSCCSHAGRRLPTYVRRALARDSGWLRYLVASDGLCILKISSGGERRRRSSCETQNRCAWALLTSDRMPWVCWRRPSSRSTQSRRESFGPPPVTAASRRFSEVFLAFIVGDSKWYRYLQPRLCEHLWYSHCTCVKWRVTLSPNTLTLSVAVTTLIDVSTGDALQGCSEAQ